MDLRLPAAPPAWVADYIGIPYHFRGTTRSGCDCWHLARLAWRHAGLDLPAYAEACATLGDILDPERRAALVAAVCQDWREIPRARVQLFDGVLLRAHGHPLHIGLMVARGTCLTTGRAPASYLERLGGLATACKVVGFHRPPSLDRDPAP